MMAVTEDDLRMPEFRGVRLDDLERRKDGKIVRKDRWERGIFAIARLLVDEKDFEIPEIVKAVEELVKLRDAQPLIECQAGRDGDCAHPQCPQRADEEPSSSGRNCPLDVPDVVE